MADFEAVIRKTLDGMTNPGPEARAKVYERARGTITRQIDAMEKRPSEAAIQRQYDKLEEAIAIIEAQYEPAEEFDPSSAALDEIFRDVPEPARRTQPAAPPMRAPAPPAPPERRSPPKAEPEDPLAAFLAEQERVASGDFSAFRAERDEEPAETARPPREGGRRMAAPAPSRKMLIWIGAAVAVLIVAGALVWFVSGLIGSSEDETADAGVTSTEVPASTAPAQVEAGDQAAQTTETAVEEGPEKFTQRLTPDGREVDEGPSQAPGSGSEGTSVAGQSDSGQPAQTAQNDTAQPPAAAAGQPAGLPVGQNAIFYQERTGSQPGTAERGSAIWSVVQESPGGDLPPEPAIRAEASIPELGMTMEMTIRRNADETFPASHVIELLFRVPDSFEGRGISDVQRITFKGTEQDPGNALIGVAAPLDTNIFMIALTDAQTAIDTNLSLMRREEWIDIPMQYVSGRRALITIEKGIPGEQVFNEVLSAWEKAGQLPNAPQN